MIFAVIESGEILGIAVGASGNGRPYRDPEILGCGRICLQSRSFLPTFALSVLEELERPTA
jgi:hypothetical protein